MILLDTSFLIALKNRADMHFARAQEIQQELFAKKYGSLFLTDYIFDEFMTFLFNLKISLHFLYKPGILPPF